MKTITLNGSTWTSPDDFYTAFFEAVGAPEWHGRNLDALTDSMVTGQVNQIDMPYALHISGTRNWTPELDAFIEDVIDIYIEASEPHPEAHFTRSAD